MSCLSVIFRDVGDILLITYERKKKFFLLALAQEFLYCL